MPVKKSASPGDRTAQQERERLLSKAYGQASAKLRAKYQDEFNGYYAQTASDLGVEWEPRLTPEQRAEKEMRELLADFPNLAVLLREEPGDGVAPTG